MSHLLRHVTTGALDRFLGEVTLTINHSVTVIDAHLTPILDLPMDEAFEGCFVRLILVRLQPKLKQKLRSSINYREIGCDGGICS